MRAIALAAVIGAGMSLAGAAFAGPWADPNGRIAFNAPSGWQVDHRQSDPQTVVLSFNASNDCYLIAAPNSITANSSADAVIRGTRGQIGADTWENVANTISPLFPNRSARVVSQDVNTSGVWPIQRAVLSSDNGPVSGAMQSRPGVDLMAFCAAVGGGDASAFEPLFASIGHPNDATWAAQAAEQAANRATNAATEAEAARIAAEREAAAAAEQPEERRRDPRRRGTDTMGRD